VVGASYSNDFTLILKVAFLAGGALYSARVLARYFSHGAHDRPQANGHTHFRFAVLWAEWLGVKALALAVKGLNQIFGMLSEASAEVGEWFLERRHHETH